MTDKTSAQDVARLRQIAAKMVQLFQCEWASVQAAVDAADSITAALQAERARTETVLAMIPKLREVAHAAYHLLEGSEERVSLDETAVQKSDVENLEKAFDELTDGVEDVHPTLHNIDDAIRALASAAPATDGANTGGAAPKFIDPSDIRINGLTVRQICFLADFFEEQTGRNPQTIGGAGERAFDQDKMDDMTQSGRRP